MAKVILDYWVRYSFNDPSKKENGRGTIICTTNMPIESMPQHLINSIEQQIAYSRNHENVSISCYSLIEAKLMD